jgi:FtsZ-binding cell division protein ZapB
LAVEFLDELERKVDILIKTIAELRKENAAFKEESVKRSSGSSEIEKENRALKKEIGVCKADLESKEEKLKSAAGRIQSLIEKIAAV